MSKKTKEGKKQISSREIASEEREELLEIIDQMAKLKEKIHEIRVKRREIWDKQRVIRAKHMKDISMAKNEKGKPIYRNKDSREAELILRLKKDEEYQRLEEKYRELRGEENRLSIEYNRLVDRKAVLTGVFFEDEKKEYGENMIEPAFVRLRSLSLPTPNKRVSGFVPSALRPNPSLSLGLQIPARRYTPLSK